MIEVTCFGGSEYQLLGRYLLGLCLVVLYDRLVDTGVGLGFYCSGSTTVGLVFFCPSCRISAYPLRKEELSIGQLSILKLMRVLRHLSSMKCLQ